MLILTLSLTLTLTLSLLNLIKLHACIPIGPHFTICLPCLIKPSRKMRACNADLQFIVSIVELGFRVRGKVRVGGVTVGEFYVLSHLQPTAGLHFTHNPR